MEALNGQGLTHAAMRLMRVSNMASAQYDRAFARLANVVQPELARIIADAYAARAETRQAVDCFMSEQYPLPSHCLDVLQTPELCSQIFSFLEENAQDLISAAAVCKTWHDMAEADVLWRAHVARDFPLCDVTAIDVSARSKLLMGSAFCAALFDASDRPLHKALYRGLASGMDFQAHVFHRDLKRGNFGAAMWNRVCYGRRTADGRARIYTIAAQIFGPSIERAPELAFIPERRVRRPPSDCSQAFRPMAQTFHSLLPGMVVELQWKGKIDAPRYNHWFALVHAVLSGGETVELSFPQYGSNAANATLGDLAAINRSTETPMHGGIAGGIRIPSVHEVKQWWDLLLDDGYDFHETADCSACLRMNALQSHTVPTGAESPLLTSRMTLKDYLPEDQPFLSLQLAEQAASR